MTWWILNAPFSKKLMIQTSCAWCEKAKFCLRMARWFPSEIFHFQPTYLIGSAWTGARNSGNAKKIQIARKPGIIFHSPEFFKNMIKCLNFMGTFTNFYCPRLMFVSKECIVSSFFFFFMPRIQIWDDFQCSPEKYFWQNGHLQYYFFS